MVGFQLRKVGTVTVRFDVDNEDAIALQVRLPLLGTCDSWHAAGKQNPDAVDLHVVLFVAACTAPVATLKYWAIDAQLLEGLSELVVIYCP